MIKGKNVSLTIKTNSKQIEVIKNVNFSLPKGKITTFMGYSGAGKTSLLRCIANLENTYDGEILFRNKAIKTLSNVERASSIGFVFQQFNLFNNMTVLDNCTCSLLNVFNMPKAKAEEIALDTLYSLGVDSLSHVSPKRISGGQKQRIAIARALVLNPKVLLLDEPTSALDPESKKSLEDIIIKLQNAGITILMSSHDMSFIKKLSNIIYFIDKGQIVECFDNSVDNNFNGKISEFLFSH